MTGQPTAPLTYPPVPPRNSRPYKDLYGNRWLEPAMMEGGTWSKPQEVFDV